MMGGYGSGGWNRSGCGTVEEHRVIDVGCLRRERVLIDGWHGSGGWWRDTERVADIVSLFNRRACPDRCEHQ